MTISIPHRLSRAEVKQRIQAAVAQFRREHGAMLHELREDWRGDRCDFFASAMGQSVTGHCVVEDTAVKVEIALPWVLQMLAGTLKQQIEQRGTHLLGKPS